MTEALNINQFGLAPVRGQVDWTIARRGTFSAKVSANQSVALLPGDPVILDGAVTGPFPQIKKAANSDPKQFFVVFNPKGPASGAITGDVIEVTGNFGPIMWMEAEATIAPGATVEDVVANGTVQTLASAKAIGIAFLNGTAGNLLPIMLTTPCVAAS